MSSLDEIVAEGWQAHQARDAALAEQKYRQVLREQPNHPKALALMASLLRQTRRPDEGLRMAQDAVRVNLGDASCEAELGLCLRDVGRFDDAVAALNRAIHLVPTFVHAYIVLGQTYLQAYRPHEAYETFLRGLENIPNDPQLTGLLGMAFLDMGRPLEAIPHFEEALGALGAVPQLQYSLGLAHKHAGNLDDAVAVFEQVIAAAPNYVDAHVGLADIEFSRGETDSARARLDPLIASGRVTAQMAMTFARICRRQKQPDDAIKLIEQIAMHSSITPPQRAHLLLSLGRLYEDKGNYDRAFEAYQRGKGQFPQTYNAAGRMAFADLVADLFPKPVIKSAPRGDVPDSSRVVFIVGMPRSGTSLVEQIVSSHPSVYGAGELDAMREIVTSMKIDLGLSEEYPWSVPGLTRAQLTQLGQEYMAFLADIDGGEFARITDKMPYNFAHLAFINMALPDARIIHCVREPMDNCLSCFATPLSAMHDYAANLTALGQEYRVYRRVMNHWKNVLDLRMLDVSYESMVADQEGETRRLIEFLDLPWDDTCLEFHASRRVVATSSIDQVRQPVYNASVGRAARFGHRLDPLRQALNG